MDIEMQLTAMAAMNCRRSKAQLCWAAPANGVAPIEPVANSSCRSPGSRCGSL